MPNNRDDHGYQLPRLPSRLEKLEQTVSSALDMILALHALNMVKGTFTHEELDKMIGIVAEARPKLSKTFTVEEGLKAIQAAFRIEIRSDKPKEEGG